MENTATTFEFIDASIPRSSNRTAARSHVMRRYHTEKRNQATREPNGSIRRPPQPGHTSVLKWRAPASSFRGSGTPLKAPDSDHYSAKALILSKRRTRATELDPRRLCRSANGKQASSTSECTCMQVQPHPGLGPVFQGVFPIGHCSLQLLRFSKLRSRIAPVTIDPLFNLTSAITRNCTGTYSPH